MAQLRSGNRTQGHRVLVTGAAGFIGSHVCRAFLDGGHDVLAVDRLDDDSYPAATKVQNLSDLVGRNGFDFFPLDVRDPAIHQLLRRSNVVVHLAGQPGVGGSWGRGFDAYVDDNIVATQRLLEATTDSGLEKFVFASSSSVYGDGTSRPSSETDEPRPVSPYGVTKLAAERLCHAYEKEFGIPTVSLRFFTVYGPRQRPDMAIARFIDHVQRGRAVGLHGGGRPVRELTYVDDAVDAILRASLGEGQGLAVNVGGGSLVSVQEMASTVAEELGLPLLAESRPPAAGDASRTWCDHGRAEAVLGYRPTMDFRAGIRAQIAATRGCLSALGGQQIDSAR